MLNLAQNSPTLRGGGRAPKKKKRGIKKTKAWSVAMKPSGQVRLWILLLLLLLVPFFLFLLTDIFGSFVRSFVRHARSEVVRP
jgi:hypothetical protein